LFSLTKYGASKNWRIITLLIEKRSAEPRTRLGLNKEGTIAFASSIDAETLNFYNQFDYNSLIIQENKQFSFIFLMFDNHYLSIE